MFKMTFVITIVVIAIVSGLQWAGPESTRDEQSKGCRKPMNFFIDKNGIRVIDGSQYLRIRSFSEGLAAAVTHDYEGVFLDKNGAIVIGPFPYDADDFSEGLSAVNIGRKRGFMDRNGRIAIETDYDRVYNFFEGIALGVKNDRSFFIDRTGQVTNSFGGEVKFEYCGGYPKFSGGLIAARDAGTGLCGYVGKTGKFVVEPQFKNAAPFSEGLGRVSIMKDRREFVGFIDVLGNSVIQPLFDIDSDFEYGATDFSDGMASIIDVSSLESFFYINRAGARIMSPTFARSDSFSDGLALVYDSRTSRCGYIDRNGNLKIPIQYDSASRFSEGLAAVSIRNCDEQ